VPDWMASAFGGAIAEMRHELLSGWCRNFEPHPSRQHDPEHEPSPERDIHGNDRGIDR
jgi:hypothetical protein